MIRISCLIVLLSGSAFGQSARVFEVASVKVHERRGGRVGIATSGPRLTAEAKTVMGLVMYAWNLRSYQVLSTPALLPFGDIFYDVAAKAEGDSVPTADKFREMMQSLLADRFRLRVHRETRELPVYALVVGKSGPKFHESTEDADPVPHYVASGRNYDVTMRKAIMEDVIGAIDNSLVDRPVLDKTGLSGAYEIRMIYTPDTPPNRKAPDPDDISIFSAVERLGLRLEAQRAPIDVLVVDSVAKPSGN
jgi:uncharacterized protein (TIGR03435 family)